MNVPIIVSITECRPKVAAYAGRITKFTYNLGDASSILRLPKLTLEPDCGELKIVNHSFELDEPLLDIPLASLASLDLDKREVRV